jgi:serine protease Do
MVRNQLSNKHLVMKSVKTVALSCLLSGLVMSPWSIGTSYAGTEKPSIPTQSVAELQPMASPFAPLAKRLTPTVVNVKVSKVEKAGFPMRQMPGNPFGEFFNHPQLPQNRTVQGAGSGVIISEDGTVLTNNHVVEGAKDVEVILADQRQIKAKVVGQDPKTDLAVLKIDAGKNLPAAHMGDSAQLQVGDWVLAIGNPFGLNHTVTSGIVSAKGRVIGAGPYDDFIQTDASINPGNSGGPLFNMKGEVVGINTAILSDGHGIGFAIPINTAKPLIPQLVSKGEVTRGYLGVSIQSISPDLTTALKLEDGKGVLVADVVAGGPAEKAGIKRGDVIVSFDGKAVHDSHDLPAMVAATPVNNEVTVVVIRDGKERQLSAKVAKLESEETALEETRQPAQGKWGLQLHDLTPQVAKQLGIKAEKGVVVVGVQPGSPAERAAIQQGDIIVEVNRKAVESAKDVKEEVAKARDANSLVLLVKGEQGSRYVVLKG